MSTTTPRLSPCEACEPIPITSTVSPGAYSPTIATTLEVPMSRPTIRDLSPLAFISGVCLGGRRLARLGWNGWRRDRRRTGGPQHGEAVAVAQVHVLEPARMRGIELRQHGEETRETRVGVLVAEQDLRAVGERERPAAARAQAHAGQ